MRGEPLGNHSSRFRDVSPFYRFAVGSSDAQRRRLTDQIKQRLSVALKPLTSSSEGA